MFVVQDSPDGCLVSVPYRPAAAAAVRRDVTALRGDVIDFSGGLAATMTSSPQSLADSALGAEGDYSTSPDQKEFRQADTAILTPDPASGVTVSFAFFYYYASKQALRTGSFV